MKRLLLTLSLVMAVNAQAATVTINNISETTNPDLDSAFVDVGISHWDTTTDLEWLDFGTLVDGSITYGHSIDSAVDTYDLDNGDWRLATYTEVYDLFDMFFGSTATRTFDEGDGTSVDVESRNSWFFAFGTDAEVFSGTITDANSTIYSRGWYLDESGDAQLMGVRLETNPLDTLLYGADYDLTGYTSANWTPTAGVFMVRDYTPPVPVPAAVWLFGSGLLGLVAVARRKG